MVDDVFGDIFGSVHTAGNPIFALDETHPMRVAWGKFTKAPEFKDFHKWAKAQGHTERTASVAFMRGYLEPKAQP